MSVLYSEPMFVLCKSLRGLTLLLNWSLSHSLVARRVAASGLAAAGGRGFQRAGVASPRAHVMRGPACWDEVTWDQKKAVATNSWHVTGHL